MMTSLTVEEIEKLKLSIEKKEDLVRKTKKDIIKAKKKLQEGCPHLRQTIMDTNFNKLGYTKSDRVCIDCELVLDYRIKDWGWHND